MTGHAASRTIRWTLSLIVATAHATTGDDRATGKTFDGAYVGDHVSTAVHSSGTCPSYDTKPLPIPHDDYLFVQGGKVRRWHGEPTVPLHEAGQIYSWRADTRSPGLDWDMSFRFFLPLGPHSAHANVTLYIEQDRTYPNPPPGTDCVVKISYIARGHRDPRTWIPQ